MFGKLLPRETSFFDYFEKHAALIVKGAQELIALMINNDLLKASQIKDIEHEADTITHQCVEALHKTFITPIEREDIHRLISRMDDIIDYIDDAADRLFLYKIQIIKPEAKELTQVLLNATLEVEQAVKGLRHLDKDEAIRKRCININCLENEADSVFRRAVVCLFEEEKDTRTLIKWKEIYEDLESAADRCEDVANIIEGVILEYY